MWHCEKCGCEYAQWIERCWWCEQEEEPIREHRTMKPEFQPPRMAGEPWQS